MQQATPTIPQVAKIDINEVYRLTDAGYSQGAVARQLGCTQGYVSRLLKRRVPVPANDDTPSQSIAAHRSEELADLQARVATLEAFMAAMQAEHRSPSQPIAAQPIAIHRSESIQWLSRGVQLAPDMLEAIDRYAAQHRLEKREVLDNALRYFFAHVEGTEGRADG